MSTAPLETAQGSLLTRASAPDALAIPSPLPPAALSRALDYPYPRPAHSYVYPSSSSSSSSSSTSTTTAALPPPLSPHAELQHLRLPLLRVLAIGSNAAPSQLLRKFGATPSPPIPVLAVTIHGVDVVHAATICSYGAVPATLAPDARATVDAHVTLLTGVQAAAMHATERGYNVVRMRAGCVRLASSGAVVEGEVVAYVSRAGAMRGADGGVRGVEAIWAEGRGEAWSQRRAQREAMQVVGEGGEVEEFVECNVRDEKRRRAFARQVQEERGGGMQAEGWDVVMEL